MFETINSLPKLQFFKEKKLLPLNLQFFSEEPPAGDPPPAPEIPNISLDAVQAFVNENPDGATWLKSLTDARVTDAINTYKTETLPRKIDEEINKRYPAETPEQKEIRELKQKFQDIENEKVRSQLEKTALSVAVDKSLPTKLIEYFIGQDETTTTNNLGVLEAEFNAAVQAKVDEEVAKRFREGGRNPNPSGTGGTTPQDSYGAKLAASKGIGVQGLEEARQQFFK